MSENCEEQSIQLDRTKMGILNLHIFNRAGNCIFSFYPHKMSEDQMNILKGFLFSLKKFTHRLSPTLEHEDNFLAYSTSDYHLVLYESPTSVKFVLLLPLDKSVDDTYFYRNLMLDIYQIVYLQFFVQNPATVDYANVTSIESVLFRDKLDELLVEYKLIYNQV